MNKGTAIVRALKAKIPRIDVLFTIGPHVVCASVFEAEFGSDFGKNFFHAATESVDSFYLS